MPDLSGQIGKEVYNTPRILISEEVLKLSHIILYLQLQHINCIILYII